MSTTVSTFPTPVHTLCSLHGRVLNRNIYAKRLGSKLRRLVSRHVDSIHEVPARAVSPRAILPQIPHTVPV